MQNSLQTDKHIKRLAASVTAYTQENPRVRYFGLVTGLKDVAHWTERSACYVFVFLYKLMVLHDPGRCAFCFVLTFCKYSCFANACRCVFPCHLVLHSIVRNHVLDAQRDDKHNS
jgi:hypothetical protein